MKAVALSVIFLVIGAAIGIWTAHRDLSGAALPSQAVLQYLDRKQSPPTSQAGPRLVMVGGETHNFGSLPLWTKSKHTFVIRNEGNETLRLVIGKPTCSCLGKNGGEPLQEGDVIEVPAGSDHPITLEWEIKSSYENFSQSAPFTTNDPKRSTLTLAIVGRVEEAVRRSRDAVVLNNVPASLAVTESVRLDIRHKGPLTVTGHRWLNQETAGFFEARFEPADDNANADTFGLIAYVTLKPGLPFGRFEQTLELTTSAAPAIPPIQVAIQGRVVGDISILGAVAVGQGHAIDLGVIPRGTPVKRKVYVMIKGPHREETQVSRGSVSPSYLRVNVGDVDSSNPNVRSFPITIEVPDDASPVNLAGGAEDDRTGLIVLETTHPTITQLKLQVQYIIRE